MKMNNKGFSMVELIIVIAIMAILVGAIAPTLIKYVNKSRKSSDASNAQTIASAMQEAYSEDGVADKVTASVVTLDTTGDAISCDGGTEFNSALTDILGKAPKKKFKKDSSTAFAAKLTTSGATSCTVYALGGDGTTDCTGDELYPDNKYSN